MTKIGILLGSCERVPVPLTGSGSAGFLAERDAELTELELWLRRGVTTGVGLYVIEGPAMCGKTALLAAAAQVAGALGIRVLSIPGAESIHSRAELVGAARALVADSGGRLPADDLGDLVDQLVSLSDTLPILIVIDDIHLLDAESLTFVRACLPRICSSRLRLLISHSGSSASRALVQELPHLAQACGGVIPVRPLTRDGVGMVLRARPAGRPTALGEAEIHAITGGNPALVHAMIDDLAADAGGASRDPSPRPAFIRVVKRLHAHNTRRMVGPLEAVAVLGADSTFERLRRLLGAGHEQLRDLVGTVLTSGILRTDLTLHPQVRDAVLAAADPRNLRHLRMRAAEVLHEEGAPSWETARHLLEADAAPQPWAAQVLCEAADYASRAGRHRRAAALLDLAADWGAGSKLACGVSDRLADMLMWGDSVGGLPWSTDPGATATGESTLSSSSSARLARYLARHGQFEEAARALDRSASAVESDASTQPQQAISGFWLRHLFPGTPHSGLAGRRDLRPVLPAEEYAWLADAERLPLLLASEAQETLVTCAEGILQAAPRDYSGLEAMVAALFSLLATERLDFGAAWFTLLLDRIGAEVSPRPWSSMLSTAMGVRAWWRGDLAGAVQAVQRADEFCGHETWGVLAGLPRGLLLVALTELGRHEEAATELTRPLPASYTASPYGLVHVRARGRHRLATGALHAALADFRHCGQALSSWGFELPGLLPWRLDLAETLLSLKEYDAARASVEEHLALSRDPYTRSHGIALRLQAATLPLTSRIPVLRKSAAVLQSYGDELELARTLARLAQAHKSTDDLATGRRVLRRAEKTARNRGALLALTEMNVPIRVGGRESLPPSGRESHTGALTPAERNIARLAAQGFTNREIAESLYVTASTVEQHLTHIYRKVGIRRRSELVAKASGL